MADVKFEVVSFDLTTGAGPQSVTISGFGTPSAAMFFLGSATADDTITADFHSGIGFSDGTNDAAICDFRVDASSADTQRGHSSARAGFSMTNAPAEEGGFSAAMITDGVSLTMDDTFPTAYRVTCVLIGGADVANAFVGTHDDLGTGTSAVDITAPGFEPDVVFLICQSINTTLPVFTGSTVTSYGCAINDGAATQRSIRLGSYAGSASTNYGYVGNTGAVGRTHNSSEWEGVVGVFDSSGFSITPSASSGSSIVSYLALSFDNAPGIDLFDMEWPTSGDYAETAPGFTPSFGLIASLAGPTARNTKKETSNTLAAMSVVAFDDTTINALTWSDNDDEATTVAKSVHNDSLKLIEDDGSTTAVEGTLDGFDASGWDFSLTTNPSEAVLGWGFAIEAAAAGSPITIEVPSGGTPY